MYNLYKYYDVLELEQELGTKFSNLTDGRGITLCPPILRHNGMKYVLAYLVLAEPDTTDNHIPVKRPIGIILRNRKNKKIIAVYNLADYEYIGGHDSFDREYYNLETYPQYWPNKSTDNEETFRILLERLYKIVSKMGFFDRLDKDEYDKYITHLYAMFPKCYHCFFDALAHNPIIPVDNEIKSIREYAKDLDYRRENERQSKLQENNELARKAFLRDIKSDMNDFIKKDIYPALTSKGSYAKIDFFTYYGKMLRELEQSTDKYLNCYNVSLPTKALKANQHSTFEAQKVNLVKTFAKACVKPLVNDKSIEVIVDLIFEFFDAQIEEESRGEVTQASTQKIRNAMTKMQFELQKISNPTALVEMKEIVERIEKDYFEGVTDADMSNLYIGYRQYHEYDLITE